MNEIIKDLISALCALALGVPLIYWHFHWPNHFTWIAIIMFVLHGLGKWVRHFLDAFIEIMEIIH